MPCTQGGFRWTCCSNAANRTNSAIVSCSLQDAFEAEMAVLEEQTAAAQQEEAEAQQELAAVLQEVRQLSEPPVM